MSASPELRALVREVLSDVLSGESAGFRSADSALSSADGGALGSGGAESSRGGSGRAAEGKLASVVADPGRAPRSSAEAELSRGTVSVDGVDEGAERVVLSSDAELDAFVRRLVQLFENPVYRRDVKAGRIRFRLADGSVSAAIPASGLTTDAVVRIDRGAVTEARIREVAKTGAGSRIVLGRAAVITPLARDRARALGVAVERER